MRFGVVPGAAIIGIALLAGCASTLSAKPLPPARAIAHAAASTPRATPTPAREFWLAAPTPTPFVDPSAAWRLPAAHPRDDAEEWRTAAADATPPPGS